MRLLTTAPNRVRRIAYATLLVVHLAIGIVFLIDRTPGTDAALTGFPLDDAWIHMVYGHSVAHSGVPYYNEGVPEAGFTSPLWILMLAVAEIISSLFPLSVVTVTKVMGMLLAWSASIGVYELCRKLEVPSTIALLAGMLAAANPMTAFAQVSGMEIALTGAVAIWAVVLFANQRWKLCGLFLGLAYWSRPECLLLLPLFISTLWWSRREASLGERTRLTLALLIPSLVAGGVWSVYCLQVSAHPLPNTFYAKFAGAHSVSGFVTILSEIVLGMPAMQWVIGAMLLVLGMVVILLRRNPVSVLILVTPWVFLGGIAFTRMMPPGCGEYFYWWRYAAPLLPMLFVPVALGAAFIASPSRFLSSLRVNGGNLWVLRIVPITLLLFCFLGYPSQLGSFKELHAWNCQNIDEVQVEIGKWVKRNVPREASVLTLDAGAIRYFGERNTIDILGLNYHDLLFDQNLSRSIGTQPDSLASYMRSAGATHYIVFPGLRPIWVNSPGFQQLFSSVMEFESRNYTVASPLQKKMVIFGLNR